MNRGFGAICTLCTIAFLSGSARAEPAVNDLAARTELRAIDTLTITDQQFLTGDRNGKAVSIAGELRLPQGLPSGKLPAVVLPHGSGGINGGNELWAKEFNEMGIARCFSIASAGAGSSARRRTRPFLAGST